MGRILNRFSRDVAILDGLLPRFLFFALTMVAGVFCNFASVVFVKWQFCGVVLVVIALFYGLQRTYKPTALQLQARFCPVALLTLAAPAAPGVGLALAHLRAFHAGAPPHPRPLSRPHPSPFPFRCLICTQTLAGLATIRAFRASERFLLQNSKNITRSAVCEATDATVKAPAPRVDGCCARAARSCVDEWTAGCVIRICS